MPELSKSGILKNIIGVITEPKEAMVRVNEEQKILKYLVSLTIIQLLIAVVELPKLISFTILKAQEAPNFSESMIPIIKNSAIVSVIVASIFSPVLIILVITALVKLATIFVKESGSFKQLFCVNILAYVPMIIAGVVGAVVISFTDPQNIKNVTTNFTVFLNSSISDTSFIYKLLSCIDLFLIWSLILVSIGTSIVYKMKIKKSLLIVFGTYIIGIIIRLFI